MQTSVPKLGAGMFVTAMLMVLTALAWDQAVMNVVYTLRDLASDYLGGLVAGIFEFLALVTWALVATVILVVVAMKQGKKEDA